MINPESRGILLNTECLALGASWAELWCARMQRQGRPVVGGWPGTVPEAKVLIRSRLDSELAARGMNSLTNDEWVIATRATYARAKQEWLSAVRKLKPRRSIRNSSLGEVET